MKEQDKVEEFTNGRVGMMIDSLAHINLIRENNPDLKFSISAIPAKDGYTGKRGIPYASWGIGVSDNSEHKAEAWKLVEFLMSEQTNAKLSSAANAFPGNTKAVPDFVEEDELFKTAFDIYKSGYPANEFTGLPVAEQLMRLFDEQFQLTLTGDQSVDEMLQKTQDDLDRRVLVHPPTRYRGRATQRAARPHPRSHHGKTVDLANEDAAGHRRGRRRAAGRRAD